MIIKDQLEFVNFTCVQVYLRGPMLVWPMQACTLSVYWSV